jgi:peroxiredoxin
MHGLSGSQLSSTDKCTAEEMLDMRSLTVDLAVAPCSGEGIDVTVPRIKFGKVLEILLWIAALAVLAQNIALVWQNRRLRDAQAPQIAAGAQLQMIAGLTLDGRIEPVNLPVAGSKLFVITFSPGCSACQANQEEWMKLANTLKRSGVRVLWVSRDPVDITRDYCLKHGIPLSDALADPPYRTYLQLRLARVPNTVLVGAGGVVEKVWAGRLDPTGWNSVYAYFGERQNPASAAQSAVNLAAASCGSAGNCK